MIYSKDQLTGIIHGGYKDFSPSLPPVRRADQNKKQLHNGH